MATATVTATLLGAPVAATATASQTQPRQATGSGVRGLDVSAYQETVDWAAVAADGASFAYVKATEGTSYISSRFAQQYDGAAAVGLIRGAYHFARPDKSSGDAQADYFVDHGGAWRPDGRTLPGVLDVEATPGLPACYGVSPAATVRWIASFDDEYRRRTGRHPVINTNASWWSQCTGNSTAFAATNLLWVGSYTGTPHPLPSGWPTYTIWQTSDSGTFPGDQDVFNGTEKDLRNLAAHGTYTPPPPPPAGAWPVVQQGYSGRQVTAIQYLLNAHGAALPIDGSFGAATHEAVVTFQARNQLTPDGVVGTKTWRALITTVKDGDHGPAVSAVQAALKAHGAALPIDGSFGAATHKAVVAFQARSHLPADGIVGPSTWLALVN
ncbi:peptidoglycan-binding protein [Streptomyces sp. RS10V-4]|uniref:GH25 family lysozyme n=1 Tax=Streptomyces rhizoryzae TaxID=2932493 RepID=UPI002005601E|nr:GH25 family lysozyme [Streptomyces rhizoryzae]MCK7622452.1 peptidoglycan-binding protein [Streptomyces rhizoryzae]